MMDLVVAMAPLVDEATMTKTFELIRPHLEVSLQQHCLSLKVPYRAKSTLLVKVMALMGYIKSE